MYRYLNLGIMPGLRTFFCVFLLPPFIIYQLPRAFILRMLILRYLEFDWTCYNFNNGRFLLRHRSSLLYFTHLLNKVFEFFAPSGNRNRGSSLEGRNVTTTPKVLLYDLNRKFLLSMRSPARVS